MQERSPTRKTFQPFPLSERLPEGNSYLQLKEQISFGFYIKRPQSTTVVKVKRVLIRSYSSS
jgi:hypothetical protein